MRRLAIGLAAAGLGLGGVATALPAALAQTAPDTAEQVLDGPAILTGATAAHGGAEWSGARSLHLSGHALFWGDAGHEPRSRLDRYEMWRGFDPDRDAAHQAEGRIRIVGTNAGQPVFTVGYDGQTTWTERGVVPKDEADVFWANNMGFGIIRHALKPGFKAERLADGNAYGDALYMVRLTDPKGGVTLFGIDQRTMLIRTMGFATPRGWHERHYGDYFSVGDSGWKQPGYVTLLYNGVKANIIFWTAARINPDDIDPAIFAPMAADPGA